MKFFIDHFQSHSMCNILTSDPAELSDKKCTRVNIRCIRSNISGYNLDCRRIEMSENVTLTRSRWMSNNDITRCDGQVQWVGDQSLESVVAVRAVRTRPSRELGRQSPRLSSPVGWERSVAIARRTGGQYVAVFVQSPSHLSYITLSKPFRIKCERFIFLKNRVRSSLLYWLCFCMHMSILHMNHTHTILNFQSVHIYHYQF